MGGVDEVCQCGRDGQQQYEYEHVFDHRLPALAAFAEISAYTKPHHGGNYSTIRRQKGRKGAGARFSLLGKTGSWETRATKFRLATSFFEKSGLSQCSRGLRETSAIIGIAHSSASVARLSVDTPPRLSTARLSRTVYWGRCDPTQPI